MRDFEFKEEELQAAEEERVALQTDIQKKYVKWSCRLPWLNHVARPCQLVQGVLQRNICVCHASQIASRVRRVSPAV